MSRRVSPIGRISPESVPEWVKNCLKKWAEGVITPSEYDALMEWVSDAVQSRRISLRKFMEYFGYADLYRKFLTEMFSWRREKSRKKEMGEVEDVEGVEGVDVSSEGESIDRVQREWEDAMARKVVLESEGAVQERAKGRKGKAGEAGTVGGFIEFVRSTYEKARDMGLRLYMKYHDLALEFGYEDENGMPDVEGFITDMVDLAVKNYDTLRTVEEIYKDYEALAKVLIWVLSRESKVMRVFDKLVEFLKWKAVMRARGVDVDPDDKIEMYIERLLNLILEKRMYESVG